MELTDLTSLLFPAGRKASLFLSLIGWGWGWDQKDPLETCGEHDPMYEFPPQTWVLLLILYKEATFLGHLFVPLLKQYPSLCQGSSSLHREMLDNTSVLFSIALLLYPFEIQCKPINSTLLLVAGCMVCILSIRKTVNPAHLFTLTSKGILHAHVSTGNYQHGLLDHEKMKAYGRIHMWTDCFFS